ncbi:unnamed protein product, partial [Didymodactylos carnosus]
TRVLVTHGISHLHKCDEIFVVNDGEIVDHGPYHELITKSKILQELVYSTIKSEDQHGPNDAEPKTPPASAEVGGILHFSDNDKTQPKVELIDEEKKLIQKEQVETGSVKFSVYVTYIRALGTVMVILIFIFFCLTAVAHLCTNIWLSKWTDDSKNEVNNNTSKRIRGLGIYCGLGITQGILTFFVQLVLQLAAYQGSKKLHSSILHGVLRAPMNFFDTTPIGRIVNRFSKDIDAIDIALPLSFSLALTIGVSFITTIVILIYGSYFAIVALIPLGIAFAFTQVIPTHLFIQNRHDSILFSKPIFIASFFLAYLQRVYISTSRQLRRLDSATRSPVYSNFGETIQGLSSIRAYNAQQRFIDLSDNLLDTNQACYLASCVANRWLAVRLDLIANLLTLSTVIFAILMRERLTPGVVGLSITSAMLVTQALNWLVRMTSDIETNIVSVERIDEYCQLQSEAAWEIPESKPPLHWPTSGQIQFQQLSTRYREGLDLVLKELTFDVRPGEKIGIIGRTGSGKSSLCITLFRIIEPVTGQIIIDNVDITKIGLHDVRSKITIIPQDAVIFAGTIRFNLDPFGTYSDEEIWNVLELTHLKHHTAALKDGLSYQLTEGGENLSAGEKQLLCIARALLRKSKIFVLDEATAAVDMETDRLIQETIRTAFKNCTVLTIAHRLHTILDSTRILVLSNGCLQEYDKPDKLASNPKSQFSKLLKDAGIRPSEIQNLSTFA